MPPTFLFAGEEFGPNNTIVKTLRALGSGAELTGTFVEVPWDLVETIVTDPGNTLEVLESGVIEIGEDAEELLARLRLRPTSM